MSAPDSPATSDQSPTQATGWEQEAPNWIAWAREPGHDSYVRFHRDQFFALLPAPGELTLDIGCGEGRVSRDLASLGHRIVGIDRAAEMLRAALAASGPPAIQADAAALPLRGGVCDLAIAFMTFQDMDDMEGALREVARVLRPGGRLCAAVVHPLNSAGKFASAEVEAPFVIAASYLDERRYVDVAERGGLTMTFHQRHRSFEGYLRAVESAGLLIEAVREWKKGDGGRWDRIPLFLHFRATKPRQGG